jgi:hypothetical protein
MRNAEHMTPYQLIFEAAEFEGDMFPNIRAEAAEHQLSTWNPDEFLQLPATRALLEKIAPSDGESTAPVTGITALAFHAYHFWAGGKIVHSVTEPVLRSLLDPAAPMIGEWPLHADAPAGYVCLPPNLVWAQAAAATPEPVHGFHYALPPAPAPRVDVLLALGVRDDRAGITAVDVSVPLPPPPPGHFGDIQARDAGDDFANILPGGELRGLFALTNAGEVLKLVSRILHHIIAPHP